MEKYGIRDNSHSIAHRYLGPNMCTADLDEIITTDGYVHSTWLEYFHHTDGDVEDVALFDYKHGHTRELKATSALKAQSRIANKLAIPFFVIVYYGLDDDYPVPMYLAVPINSYAKIITQKPKWLSVRGFSMFLHDLRKLPFKYNAPIFAPRWDAGLAVLSKLVGRKVDAGEQLCCGDLRSDGYRYHEPDVSEVERGL